MEPGTVGWFQCPGYPAALGVVLDHSDPTVSFEGFKQGETDTFVCFYPLGAGGWWMSSSEAPDVFRRLDEMTPASVASHFGLSAEQLSELETEYASLLAGKNFTQPMTGDDGEDSDASSGRRKKKSKKDKKKEKDKKEKREKKELAKEAERVAKEAERAEKREKKKHRLRFNAIEEEEIHREDLPPMEKNDMFVDDRQTPLFMKIRKKILREWNSRPTEKVQAAALHHIPTGCEEFVRRMLVYYQRVARISYGILEDPYDLGMSEGPLDAVIVGRGLEGMTAARQLHNFGLRCCIVAPEEDHRPSAMDAVVAWESATGGPLNVLFQQMKFAENTAAGDDSWVVVEKERILCEKLMPEGTKVYPAAVTAIVEKEGGLEVDVVLSTGETLSAKKLIVAVAPEALPRSIGLLPMHHEVNGFVVYAECIAIASATASWTSPSHVISPRPNVHCIRHPDSLNPNRGTINVTITWCGELGNSSYARSALVEALKDPGLEQAMSVRVPAHRIGGYRQCPVEAIEMSPSGCVVYGEPIYGDPMHPGTAINAYSRFMAGMKAAEMVANALVPFQNILHMPVPEAAATPATPSKGSAKKQSKQQREPTPEEELEEEDEDESLYGDVEPTGERPTANRTQRPARSQPDKKKRSEVMMLLDQVKDDHALYKLLTQRLGIWREKTREHRQIPDNQLDERTLMYTDRIRLSLLDYLREMRILYNKHSRHPPPAVLDAVEIMTKPPPFKKSQTKKYGEQDFIPTRERPSIAYPTPQPDPISFRKLKDSLRGTKRGRGGPEGQTGVKLFEEHDKMVERIRSEKRIFTGVSGLPDRVIPPFALERRDPSSLFPKKKTNGGPKRTPRQNAGGDNTQKPLDERDEIDIQPVMRLSTQLEATYRMSHTQTVLTQDVLLTQNPAKVLLHRDDANDPEAEYSLPIPSWHIQDSSGPVVLEPDDIGVIDNGEDHHTQEVAVAVPVEPKPQAKISSLKRFVDEAVEAEALKFREGTDGKGKISEISGPNFNQFVKETSRGVMKKLFEKENGDGLVIGLKVPLENPSHDMIEQTVANFVKKYQKRAAKSVVVAPVGHTPALPRPVGRSPALAPGRSPALPAKSPAFPPRSPALLAPPRSPMHPRQ